MPTELQSLAKIFNNRFFRIPDYQRGFAWETRQLSDFWSDLQRAAGDRRHYCGQLTLERVAEPAWRHWEGDAWLVEDAGYDPYFVVDGQQRLTTAVILVQCLLENLPTDTVIAGDKVSTLSERFLVKGHGVLRSCLFGYDRDNPSHEFFRTQILGVPSNEYHGVRTVYTSNLVAARDFFRGQIERLQDPGHRERLFKTLSQRVLFNIHELSDDLDVFVAFETMNNRGKPLSRLELLKNRLIYLSTLAQGSDAERAKVRGNINAVWRTVYEELGRKPGQSLDDDEFLRAHWIVFFGYDKDEADPLTQFLLNKHFTPERLDKGQLSLEDIQRYVDSLQISAKVWQRLHFPEDHEGDLGLVAPGLIRLTRLGFGVLRPLLLAALSRSPTPAELLPVVNQAERFLLLVRGFAGTRVDVAEAESYRFANALNNDAQTLSSAAEMLANRVARHFTMGAFQTEIDELFAEDGRGFYDLPALKFLLFEYEESLRIEAKSAASKMSWKDFRGARNSVEHVYPQTPDADDWPQFANLTSEQQRRLTHTLGNLVGVSVAKNAGLSRRSFAAKKQGTEKIPGFSQGSFSELEIAQFPDWTPSSILQRGMKMLRFVEKRWAVTLGNDEDKKSLLGLGFL